MIGHLNIGSLNFVFVFKHKWQKDEKHYITKRMRDYRLGIWFKRNKALGKKNNYVNVYMLGVNLIVAIAWVTVERGALKIKVDVD